MVVINLFQKVTNRLADVLGKLNSGDFPEWQINRSVSRLLNAERLGTTRRCMMFLAMLYQLSPRPFDSYLGRHDYKNRIQKALNAIDPDTGALDYDGKTLELHLRDGTDFTIPADQISALACDIRCCAELVGWDFFIGLMRDIEKAGTDNEALSTHAKTLSEELDRFRQRELGSSSVNQKKNALVAYLNEAFGQENFGFSDLTDMHILAFWEAYATDERIDVRTYLAAHELFSDYVFALKEVLRPYMVDEVDAPVAGKQGEEDWQSPLEDSADGLSGATAQEDLEAICQKGIGVKFLTGTESDSDRHRVLRMAALSSGGAEFPLSTIFVDRFDPVQSALGRRKDGDPGLDRIVARSLPWNGALAAIDSVRDKLEATMYASLYVLLTHHRDGAFTLATTLDNDVREALVTRASGLRGTQDEAEDIRVSLLHDLTTSDETVFASIREKALKGWKSTKREGFREENLPDTEIVDTIDRHADHLVNSYHYLALLHSRFSKIHPDEAEMQEIRCRFNTQFETLYPSAQWRSI